MRRCGQAADLSGGACRVGRFVDGDERLQHALAACRRHVVRQLLLERRGGGAGFLAVAGAATAGVSDAVVVDSASPWRMNSVPASCAASRHSAAAVPAASAAPCGPPKLRAPSEAASARQAACRRLTRPTTVDDGP